MEDVVAREVLAKIGQQMRAAVEAAKEHYEAYMADEDAVTGALGGTFDHFVKGEAVHDGRRYSWSTHTRKLRGRGRGADEKRTGADGIFEVEVWEADKKLVARKSVLFQAKNARGGDRRKLAEQARKISALPGKGCVVDYSREAYTAVDAQSVADHAGAWPETGVKPLGDYLADDFLPCRVGTREAYYDASRRLLLFVPDGGTLAAEPLAVDHRIRTTVVTS